MSNSLIGWQSARTDVCRAFKRSMIYRFDLFETCDTCIPASFKAVFLLKSCIDRFHRSTISSPCLHASIISFFLYFARPCGFAIFHARAFYPFPFMSSSRRFSLEEKGRSEETGSRTSEISYSIGRNVSDVFLTSWLEKSRA